MAKTRELRFGKLSVHLSIHFLSILVLVYPKFAYTDHKHSSSMDTWIMMSFNKYSKTREAENLPSISAKHFSQASQLNNITKAFLMVFRYALFKLHRKEFEFPTISTFSGSCVIFGNLG